MPMFLGPPCNIFWYKTRFDRKTEGGGLTADVVPESKDSGCFIEFSEEGMFFLDPNKKYQSEKWKDIMEWIIGLPEWGVSITPAPFDEWWRVPANAREWNVSFSKGDVEVKMTVKRKQVDGTVVDAVRAIGTVPGETVISTGE